MKKRFLILAALLAAGIFLPIQSHADTFNPVLTDDATVLSSIGSFNYGGVTSLLVTKAYDGNGSLAYERQAYLKFDLSDLAGTNPADVTSVLLKFYVNGGLPGDSVDAYHSPDYYLNTTAPWVEGTGLGQIAPGITWNNKPDLTGALLMGSSPNLAPILAYYTIDLLEGGNGWLAGDLSDGYLSVALLYPDPDKVTNSYYFCSKESNPITCLGPSLEIQTSPSQPPGQIPEPVSLLLLGSGLAVLAGVRIFRK